MLKDFNKDIILSTKLQPPQIKGKTLYRERLIKLLKENWNRKLVLINASAGYGKTTLLAHFLPEINIPYVFYHLEPSDSALVVFLSYLTAGIKNICAKFGKRTNALLNSIEYSDEYLEILVGTFINELVEKISGDLLVILDDYHNINRAKQVELALNYLFNHAPPFLHFIISTRQTPNFLLPQMRARREIFELTNWDFKFTSEETKRLFEGIHSIPLGENELKILAEHSEGWITSLQLILQSSMGDVTNIQKLSEFLSDKKNYHEWQADYFNYFAQEIYKRESAEIQQFMVDCSILEWLNQDACYAITKQYDSENILQNLEARNAFLFRTSDDNYRFHNLFRNFLLSKLSDSEHKKKVFLAAASYFYKKHQLEDAVQYYLEVQDFKKVIKIINKIGGVFVTRGKSNTLFSYIKRLPESMVNQNADLLITYGLALMFLGYPEEATVTYLKAIKICQKRAKLSFKLADACYRLATLNYTFGNNEIAKKWLIKAYNACPKRDHPIRAAILSALGGIYSRMGRKKFDEARDCFYRAFQIVKKFPKNYALDASILNNWAMLERRLGNLKIAYEKFLVAVDLLKKEGNFSPDSGIVFCNAAQIGLLLGKIKRAHEIIELGDEISKRYNSMVSLAMIWEGHAKYYEKMGDLLKAKEYLKKSIDFCEGLKLKRHLMTSYQSLCQINTKIGFIAEAAQNLAIVWEIKKSRDGGEAISTLIVEAKLRMAQDKLDEAEKILSHALRLAEKDSRIFDLFVVLLELAKVFYKKAMIREANDILRQALKMNLEKGYDYRFAQELKDQKWMIESLMKSDKRYILSLLNQYQIPYHFIEIFLFGEPQVNLDGKALPAEVWQTSKTMKLFCYLSAHKEKPLSRDILVNAIWPDASLRSGSESLRKAMQHIRDASESITATKDNPIIYKSGLYQISEDFSIWMDTEEFIRMTHAARKSHGDYKEFKDNIKKIMNLYQDGLAKEWYDEWIEEMRRNYSEIYEECLSMLVDECLKNGDYKEGLVWIKKLISKNFYEEEYHKKLWKIYAQLKKYREIKQDFVKLEQSFEKELKTNLQPETIEFYKSLIK